MGSRNDPTKFLVALYRKINSLTSGKSGSPGLTAFSRALLLLIMIPVAGPILWNAVIAMPTGVAVIIGLGLALRVAFWFMGRSD